MPQEEWIQALLPDAMGHLLQCRECPRSANTKSGMNLAGKKAVCDVLDDLIAILFPGCHGHGPADETEVEADLRNHVRGTALALKGQIRRALDAWLIKRGQLAEKTRVPFKTVVPKERRRKRTAQ